MLSKLIIAVLLGFFITNVTARSESALDTLGNYWSPISGVSNGDIKTVSIDSSGFIYVSIWGEGIFRSTNSGTSWTDITNDLSFPNVTAIEFDSTGAIYLGTLGGGVFRSTNNGNSWVEVNTGLTNKRVTSLKIYRGGPMYAGTIGGGVFRSTNGGRNWTQVNNGLKFWHITAMILSDYGAVVVGTPNDGVWRSTDQGENWQRANGSISSRNITSFARNLQGELAVGTLGGGVCISIDGGGGWSVYNEDDKCVDVTAVVFADINAPVAGLAKDGIVWYDDQIWLQWRLSSMRSSGITALARSANNTLWAAIPLMGLYKSTDKGASWTYVDFATQFSKLEVFGLKDGYVLSTAKDTSLLISSDYGVTWEGGYLRDYTITAFGLDSTGGWLVGALSKTNPTTGYLFRSADNGQNWTPLWAKRDTSVVAIGVNTQGHIYCGLRFPPDDPKDPNSIMSEIYVSTNNGTDWMHKAAKSPADGFEFVAINFNDEVYINQDDGLYKSNDGGDTWTQVLADNIARVSSIDFSSNNDVYCGTDLGLFKSTNNGTNWITNDFGMTYPDVKKIIVTINDQIIVGLAGNNGFLCSGGGGTGFYEINRGFIQTYLWSMSQSRDGFIYIASNTLYRGIEPPAMVPPAPVSPQNNTEGVDRNATFTWDGNPKADMYEFQISESNDFFIIGEKLTIGKTSHKLRYTLKPATRYFWRVRSRTNSAMSEWSEIMAFMTIIEAPELVSPENHSGSHDTAGVAFYWHPVDSASLYVFELATDSRFSNIISTQEVADTNVTVGGLELYKKYYWRVKGRTFKADGPWSEIWDFTTKMRPPVLKAPPDGSSGHPTVVLLEWFETDGGVKYEIQLARDSLFQDMVFEGLTESNTSQRTKVLEYFKTYWWRVRALNDDGQSDWSEAWKFTTIITAAELIEPTDKSVDLDVDITFKWRFDDDATNYHIQISKNAGFTDIIFEDTDVIPDTINVSGFEHFTKYYWRVRKMHNELVGLWSDTWSFTTGIGQVQIISPENGAENQPTDMTFIWELLKGADIYIFQLALTDDFSSLVKYIETDQTQVEVNDLEQDTKYYFRVKGKYTDGEGEWSEVYEFTTQIGAGVYYDETDSDIKVYPNPFVATLNIEFNLLKDSNVNLEIRDARGTEIATILSGRVSAGRHIYEYLPSELSQGSYLVILTIDGKQAVRQVIMIK